MRKITQLQIVAQSVKYRIEIGDVIRKTEACVGVLHCDKEKKVDCVSVIDIWT